MTTVGTVITDARSRLLGTIVEQRNLLASSVTSSDTTLTFTYDLLNLTEHTVVEIDTELMYVWSVNDAAKTATVERGFNGTIAASHAAGAATVISPRFPRAWLLRELNNDLADLSSPDHGLFRVVTVAADYDGRTRMMNIPSATSVTRLLSVAFRDTTRDWYEIRDARLVREQDTTELASGFAVVFPDPPPSGTVRITYASTFTAATSESDDLTSVCGLPDTCTDIVTLGMQLRLMVPREMARNFTESQGDTRRPDEVPPGAIQSSWQGVARLRRDRIQAEAARLKRLYPQRATR